MFLFSPSSSLQRAGLVDYPKSINLKENTPSNDCLPKAAKVSQFSSKKTWLDLTWPDYTFIFLLLLLAQSSIVEWKKERKKNLVVECFKYDKPLYCSGWGEEEESKHTHTRAYIFIINRRVLVHTIKWGSSRPTRILRWNKSYTVHFNRNTHTIVQKILFYLYYRWWQPRRGKEREGGLGVCGVWVTDKKRNCVIIIIIIIII